MQVKLILVLFTIFTISDCHEVDNGSILTFQTETNHTKLPLFPRMNIKFIVDLRKKSKKAAVEQDIITKRKPLMPKIVITTRTKVNINNKVAVTRKPLMKRRKFTVNVITNRTLQKSNDDQNFTKKKYELNANNSVTKDRLNDLKHKTEEIQIFTTARARDDGQTEVPSTTVNYFAEEHKDRKEYIFLNSTNDDQVAVQDLLQMDEGDLETTTATVDVKENLRSKRSVNIIEEENRVTAIPLQKYTDHDTIVKNDKFLKNVNT